jgi:dienelactone hydrolase
MPITFQERTAGGVPLLLAVPVEQAAPPPMVLWFHGFNVDAAVHRPELERVAEAGFLAVGVDAAGHGRRRLPDFDERLEAPREEVLRLAVRLAAETAAEVPVLVRALVKEDGADARRIAAVGISMGAYVVYGAVVAEPALRAAVAILGSPEWPHPDSPHRELEALHRTRLLSITAERDENVPPAAARALHRALAERWPHDRRDRYVELPGAVHLMGAEHWATTMDETLRWLATHAR